jgi:hypothetical protein
MVFEISASNIILMHNTILDNPVGTSKSTNGGKDKLCQQYDSNGIVGVHFKSRKLVFCCHTIHHDFGVMTSEDNDSINKLSIPK